jgi:hypothetical protein
LSHKAQIIAKSIKPVDKNKRPLGMVRRDVDRREPNQRSTPQSGSVDQQSSPVDQRICGDAHFMTIKIEVDVVKKVS